jgi:DivIVA domain-containing protein
VPLDRQGIEKRDFPIGRRGYDPTAVDAHLGRLADEMEALQRQAKRRNDDSLAQTASEQVRAIVQAAEASGSSIERAAEEEAQQIRADAARDAERTRADAVERAQDLIGKVSAATGEMLQRVEAMQSELGTLVDALRTGANRVNADLSLLETSMSELSIAVGGEERHAEADLPRTPDVEEFSDAPVAVAPEPKPVTEPEPVSLAEAPAPPAEPVAAEPSNGDADGDVEGARLIALNMALNGQPREETDRYLAENFDLADRERLLDEVYEAI